MQRLIAFFAANGTMYAVARFGLIMVFIMFGIGKFNAEDAAELAGVVASHPILGLGPKILGDLGFAIFLGTIELICAGLLILGYMSARFGFIGGLLAVVTFLTTSTLLLFVPIWRQAGLPFSNFNGLFLFKDLGLLAASIMIANYDARRLMATE